MAHKFAYASATHWQIFSIFAASVRQPVTPLAEGVASSKAVFKTVYDYG